jgi:hypothetical protein
MKLIVKHVLDSANMALWILQNSNDVILLQTAAKLIRSANDAMDSLERIKRETAQRNVL